MSEEWLRNGPCPDCGSSDARAVYSDGHEHCFSCGAHTRSGSSSAEPSPASAPGGLIAPVYRDIPARGLRADVCRKLDYGVGMYRGRPCHVATYHDTAGRPAAQKLRFQDKSFLWVGDPKRARMFGAHLWRTGGRRIVVTEGEIDAVSVAQAFGGTWPVISVKDGASSAVRCVRQEMEWLSSYEDVVFCFDMDAPGREAAAAAAALLPPGKARIAHLPRKDANEMILHGEVKGLLSAIFEARPWRPEAIRAGEELWRAALRPTPRGRPYPWPSLTDVTYGQRPGEMVMWGAGTGVGKSQFLRQVTHDLLRSGERVGVIALEESVQRVVLGQLSLSLGAALHLPHVRETADEAALRKAFEEDLRDRLFVLDHFGSLDPGVLLPKLRFLAVGEGVRWIVLDHLTIVMSGMAAEGDERKRLDELLTALRTLVSETGIGLHVVSHLRKASGSPHEEGGRVTLDDFRGTGAIKHLSDVVIALERDQQAEDDRLRHLTRLRVLKNRFVGVTGPAGWVEYDPTTTRLSEVPGPPEGGSDGEDDVPF